jgi:hypothetical protein
MASLLDKLKDSINKRQTTIRAREAADWFRSKARLIRGAARAQFQSVTPDKLFQERDSTAKSSNVIGKMYGFYYDPKHKLTLPHYDNFPLIFPIESYSDGFLGINLHYISPFYRAVLMDKLNSLASNRKYDASTKLRISYSTLNEFTKYKHAKPCIKRYLFGHIRSQLVNIDADEWEVAIFLPVERFKKESKQAVWAKSSKQF